MFDDRMALVATRPLVSVPALIGLLTAALLAAVRRLP